MEKKLSEEQKEILYSCGTEVPGQVNNILKKEKGFM